MEPNFEKYRTEGAPGHLGLSATTRRASPTPPFFPERGDAPLDRDPAPFSLEDGDTLRVGERTFVVADAEVVAVYRRLSRVATTDLSVLILGETGTGKEVAASAIRHWSRRRRGPFITLNCGALPETLAESEIFGYERGAFSGAVRAKPGLLESAHGGVLFLDEIGDLSLAAQAKLLRVLETRCVTRLGSVVERAVDCRFVAATHKPLLTGVKEGWFREDLYYRLSAAVVKLPPLRDRPRELALLIRRFLDGSRQRLGLAPCLVTDAAIARLRSYAWPGNIRELKNVMECLAAEVTEGAIDVEHVHLAGERLAASEREAECFTPPIRTPEPSGAPLAPHPRSSILPLADAKREFERMSIESALAATGGNRTRAAKLLQIPLRTLMDMIKRHGIR